jgi:uncharacterized protein YjbJ (UPF0337 family)
MNEDTLGGEGRDIIGKIKETAGDAVGSSALQAEGLSDQVAGKVNKVVGAVKDGIAENAPTVEEAKRYVKARPFAFAALAGVVGLALLNTLRGRR